VQILAERDSLPKRFDTCLCEAYVGVCDYQIFRVQGTAKLNRQTTGINHNDVLHVGGKKQVCCEHIHARQEVMGRIDCITSFEMGKKKKKPLGRADTARPSHKPF
jgi:hypothetical protein